MRFGAEYSSVPRAQEARIKTKEKHLAGLSIFGPIFKKSFEVRDGRELRILHEVGLTELSLTAFPASIEAMVTAAKGGHQQEEDTDDPLSEVWICDMKSALAITSKSVRKTAVDLLVRAQYPTLTKHADEKQDEVDAGDKPTPIDDDDDSATYALSLIGQSGPVTPPGGEPSDSLADLLASENVAKTSAELDAIMAEFGAPDRAQKG